METKIVKHSAETVYVNHPTASYGIFCFNNAGDFFLNSDWGFYGFAWRSYGTDFKAFLAQCDPDYMVGKFSINYQNLSGRRMPANTEKNLMLLVKEFINAVKSDLAALKTETIQA